MKPNCLAQKRDFRPNQLAGFRIGDKVRLSTVSSLLTMIDFQPPSLLVLESGRGQQLTAGWKVVLLDTSIPLRQSDRPFP